MASNQIILDSKAAEGVIEKALAMGAKGMATALKIFGVSMQHRTAERFDREESPDGEKWAPLADSTILARLRKSRGRIRRPKAVEKFGKRSRSAVGAASFAAMSGKRVPILRDTARLSRSIQAPSSLKVAPFEMALSAPVAYASAHQEGTRRIPARPFLGFNDRDEERLTKIIADQFEKEIAG